MNSIEGEQEPGGRPFQGWIKGNQPSAPPHTHCLFVCVCVYDAHVPLQEGRRDQSENGIVCERRELLPGELESAAGDGLVL